MASAVNRFGSQLIRQSFRTRPSLKVRQLRPSAPFHRTAHYGDEGAQQKPDASSAAAGEAQESTKKSIPRFATAAGTPSGKDEIIDYGEVDEDPVEREGFLRWPVGMTREQKDKELADWKELLANPPEEAQDAIAEYKRSMSKMQYEMNRAMDAAGEELDVEENFLSGRDTAGFMAMGEDDLEEDGPDDVFEGDDITSLAHNDLEQHREIRHYMRLAAWEMPLLTKFAKKFEPPGKEQPLRFRHTSYMGESHPAEKKIVVEFCTADLPLTPKQRLKLIKLVGARYSPQTDTVRMSHESFDSSMQNKRYLGDLVDTLLVEAKNDSTAEGGKDAFDDIPVDFRHVKWKKRLAFPEAWKMTPERQAALEQARARQALEAESKKAQGLLVDGDAIVQQSLQSAQSKVRIEAPAGGGSGAARSRARVARRL